jgi:hypothetical protein
MTEAALRGRRGNQADPVRRFENALHGLEDDIVHDEVSPVKQKQAM